MKILTLILAAGQGKRMHSNTAKVLQPLGGRPMISHLLDTVLTIPEAVSAVIYGHQGEQLQRCIQPLYPRLLWVHQARQLGTGDAVKAAWNEILQADWVLIITGDTPLIEQSTLLQLLAGAKKNGFALLTAHNAEPFGYGRIIRDDNGGICAIVEEKDATPQQQQITEVNTGIMALKSQLLRQYLPLIQNNNAQGEYYLTDLIQLCHNDGHSIDAVQAQTFGETLGINTRAQLAQAENIYRQRQSQKLLDAGVTLIDPTRIDIHATLNVGQDVVIEPNVFFKGKVVLGNRVYIESGCTLIDCNIGDDVKILSHSRLEQCQVHDCARIGPFARLRPGSIIGEHARIGNFVEIKAANIGYASKVNHLSYIGDACLGKNVNIGAGTITCNYDGANKYRTELGDRVFIGSNTALVAPVSVGNDATVGAGSVITKNIAPEVLALGRSRQKNIIGWQRPKKTDKPQ